MNKHVSIIAGLSLAAGLFAALPVDPPDYTSLPPAPADMHRKLSASQVTLEKAIEIARKATNGVPASASFGVKDGEEVVNVTLYTNESQHRIVIEAKSGEIVATEQPQRFPGDPVEGEPQKTESGLMYYVIREGAGPKPAGPTSRVKVHYTGWLVDGTKFDSSVDRGAPATFPLNGVISGWTEGVGDMRVGEKRKLIVPYQLGYGAGGKAPVIPPKAILIFDVELLEVVGE